MGWWKKKTPDLDVKTPGKKPDLDVKTPGKKPDLDVNAPGKTPGKTPSKIDDIVDDTGKVKPEVKKKWGKFGDVGEILATIGIIGLSAAAVGFLPGQLTDAYQKVSDMLFGWAPEELQDSFLSACSLCSCCSSCCCMIMLVLLLVMASGGGDGGSNS